MTIILILFILAQITVIGKLIIRQLPNERWKSAYFSLIDDLNQGLDAKIIAAKFRKKYNLSEDEANIGIRAAQLREEDWFKFKLK